jgi:hypothetical protein
MEQKHIDSIISLFHEAGVWNSGKFSESVNEYCKANNLDAKLINKYLEEAFSIYLRTNISSEGAIQFKLSQIKLLKVTP